MNMSRRRILVGGAAVAVTGINVPAATAKKLVTRNEVSIYQRKDLSASPWQIYVQVGEDREVVHLIPNPMTMDNLEYAMKMIKIAIQRDEDRK